MAYAPSNILPGTTETIDVSKIAEGFVCGMVNEDTGTLEVVQFGQFADEERTRVGFHYQTGTQRFEGFVADVAGLKLYKLPRSLATAGAAYRRARNRPHCPVPVCRSHEELVAANCD
jgi:hypothetical protein